VGYERPTPKVLMKLRFSVLFKIVWGLFFEEVRKVKAPHRPLLQLFLGVAYVYIHHSF
jgi:hypothetical protein